MSTFPGSPKLVKGGLVLLDPESSAVVRVVVLQYNPDSVSRSFAVRGGEGGSRSEPLRLSGPPTESIKVDAELDAADQMETGDPATADLGLHPQLAALETILYPTSGQLLANDRLARSGVLEIIPMESPLTLFVWSKHRIVPVRITDLSVTEEAFDPLLNPIRAKVSLGMKVLTVDDLGFAHKGGSLYMAYHQQKERFAAATRAAAIGLLGIQEVP